MHPLRHTDLADREYEQKSHKRQITSAYIEELIDDQSFPDITRQCQQHIAELRKEGEHEYKRISYRIVTALLPVIDDTAYDRQNAYRDVVAQYHHAFTTFR